MGGIASSLETSEFSNALKKKDCRAPAIRA